MGNDVIRTEHAGAKNGGGYWGPRQDAKDLSRKKRRSNDRKAISEELNAEAS